jgi:membrane-associated phospholipid phosphatase
MTRFKVLTSGEPTPDFHGWHTTSQPALNSFSRRQDENASAYVMLVTSSLAWLASLVTLYVFGLQAAVPWELGALLGVRVLPFALVVLFCAKKLHAGHIRATIGIGLGLLSIAIFPAIGLWAVLALPAGMLGLRLVNRHTVLTTIIAVAAMALGYAAVWNANYLCAYFRIDRLQDAYLMKLDFSLFQMIGLRSEGVVYPLVTGWASTAFESAYVMLFPQVILTGVVMAIHRRGEFLGTYMRAIFIAYALGLLIFVSFPTVGPIVTRPELVHPAYRSSMTAYVAQRSAEELTAVRSGGDLNGIAFFPALPSLHVAQACIAAIFLWRIRVLWYWFLPINVAILLSTVILGMHYIIDIPAGALVALAAVALAGASARCRDTRGEATPAAVVPA